MVNKIRLGRALQIRKASLEVLRTRGTMTEVGGLPGRTRAATHGGLSMHHHTPFQRLPKGVDRTKYERALLRQRGQKVSSNLDYGLDIWNENGKVFNLEWSSDDREFQIVAFKRGTWEDVLLSSV